MYATLVWSFFSAVALLLAIVFGLMWLLQRNGRRDHASLMVCVLGLASAAATYVELGMMHAQSPAEYGEWLRWYHVPNFIAIVSQLLFVRLYLGTGRLWLIGAIVLARSILLVVNFSVDPSFNFTSIDSLRQISVFGESVSVIAAATPRNEWLAFSWLTYLLIMAYFVDASAQRWMVGAKIAHREALAVSFAFVGPLLLTILYSQSIVFGLFQGPVTNVAWFLGALVAMGYEFGRYMVLNSRAQLHMAELRNQMAQTERVNLLGQLATALAHELAQPLAAISTNVGAAQKRLSDARLSDEALHGSLHDIGADERRASEIIVRMRELLKKRSIAMRPLALDDVVDDVIALVDSQAQAKKVDLHVVVDPDLPQVLGDRLHLSQVLLNLIVNGIQAVEGRPPGKRRIEIEARRNGHEHEVELIVSDSGPGVAEIVADDIFSPLITTKPDGTGVGLAIARSIVEAHDGRIWIERAKALGGAAFHLTLKSAGNGERNLQHRASRDTQLAVSTS